MRKAEVKDIPAIMAMLEESMGNGYMDENKCREHIESPKSFLYVEEDEGKVVASTLYIIENMQSAIDNSKEESEVLSKLSRGEPIIHCKFLCVDKKHQKGGFGRKLITELEAYIEKIKAAGLVYTVLCEYNNAIPAKSIFEKNGFSFRKKLGQVWYEDEDYYCAVCKGRCRCEGYTYFKKIGE
ncbi:MAG: GNAT family N-acetyltransferase [Lachnospiraceae bacterium]|nr:GNAT family N-acetyltransferase [Lachnospiraceae bacterium]